MKFLKRANITILFTQHVQTLGYNLHKTPNYSFYCLVAFIFSPKKLVTYCIYEIHMIWLYQINSKRRFF